MINKKCQVYLHSTATMINKSAFNCKSHQIKHTMRKSSSWVSSGSWKNSESSWVLIGFRALLGSWILIRPWALLASWVLIRSWILIGSWVLIRVLRPPRVLGLPRILRPPRALRPLRVLGPVFPVCLSFLLYHLFERNKKKIILKDRIFTQYFLKKLKKKK